LRNCWLIGANLDTRYDKRSLWGVFVRLFFR